MKISKIYLTAITFLAIISEGVSQSVAVKGHVAANFRLELFSAGIGVEKHFDHHFSMQLTYNNSGWDLRNTDGDASFYSSLIPEVRYYFHWNKENPANKKYFLGIFSEFTNKKSIGSGDYSEKPVVFTVSSTGQLINPGILIGKCLPVGKKCFAEFFGGPKYRFIYSSRVLNHNGVIFTATERNQKWGLRAGVNIGVRF
ncbi:MAG: DUF3575 domain-containing protein [Bacteroidota bacterium]